MYKAALGATPFNAETTWGGWWGWRSGPLLPFPSTSTTLNLQEAQPVG